MPAKEARRLRGNAGSRQYFSLSFQSLCFLHTSQDFPSPTGSLSENEDPPLALRGLYGNGIKCQTSASSIYHCGIGTLSANHYLLVNLSFGQVTVTCSATSSTSVVDPKKSGCECLYTCLYMLFFSVNLKHTCWVQRESSLLIKQESVTRKMSHPP